MEILFSQKAHVIFTLLLSAGVFAYFKYIKNELPHYKVSLILGLIFFAVGWLSITIFLKTSDVPDFMVFDDRAPFSIKKLFMLAYTFILTAGMTFLSEKINGQKET